MSGAGCQVPGAACQKLLVFEDSRFGTYTMEAFNEAARRPTEDSPRRGFASLGNNVHLLIEPRRGDRAAPRLGLFIEKRRTNSLPRTLAKCLSPASRALII